MSGTDYTKTPNLGLYLPIYDADDGMWGTHLNANATTLDSAVHALQAGGPFLPLAGTVTNDSAAPGNIGEYISASVSTPSAAPLTTAVALNVTNILLTPGDWDVSGSLGFSLAATTSVTMLAGGINTTSGFLPNVTTGPVSRLFLPAFVPGAVSPIISLATGRISLAVTTPVYLVALANFTVAGCGAFGFIGARRVR